MSSTKMLCKIILIAFSITVMVIPLTLAKPCFITNCPPGGKRSGPIEPLSQCISCGPEDGGRCLGPHLCCGPKIGCFMKTKETSICLLANLTSTGTCNHEWWQTELGAQPCHLDGIDSDGTCVSEGLCCSNDKCQVHSECSSAASTYQKRMNELFVIPLEARAHARARLHLNHQNDRTDY